MAEIKSTLDLVMERTRHLTLSDDEKRAQRTEEGTRRLQGLIQRYADGDLGAEGLVSGAEALGGEFGFDGRARLAAAAAARIDPDGNDARWLELLAKLAPERAERAKEALEGYRRDRAVLDARHAAEALERLAADGISGPAVAPNLAAAPAWRDAVEGLRQAFAEGLSQEANGDPEQGTQRT